MVEPVKQQNSQYCNLSGKPIGIGCCTALRQNSEKKYLQMKFEPYIVRYNHNQVSLSYSEFWYFVYAWNSIVQWRMTVDCESNLSLRILKVNLENSRLENEKVNKVNPKISTEKEKISPVDVARSKPSDLYLSVHSLGEIKGHLTTLEKGQSKIEDRVNDCASKEEIAKLATKESVQATKESVQELKGSVEKLEKSVETKHEEVKEEIAKLATKESAEKFEKSVETKHAEFKEEIAKLATKESVQATKESVQELKGSVEKLEKSVETKHEEVKEEIAKLATKESAEKFEKSVETKHAEFKDVIANLATKEEIANLATKESVEKLEQSVEKKHEEVKEEIANLKGSIGDEIERVTEHKIAKLANKGLIAVIVILVSEKLEFDALANFVRSLF